MADVKICDRCGAVFGRRSSWINVQPERHIVSFITRRCVEPEGYYYNHVDKDYDLCLDCRDALERFLRGQAVEGIEEN